jgi:plasmid stabilization system protein ParE
MRLPVVLTPQAAVEFDAASDWYQERADLGAEFTSHVRDALRYLGEAPQAHPAIHRDICRVTLKQFPYNIYFRRKPHRVEVIAILHGRRDPSVWKKR